MKDADGGLGLNLFTAVELVLFRAVEVNELRSVLDFRWS